MTKKDKELLAIMKAFRNMTEKEQGFLLGLAEGMVICKPKLDFNDELCINKLVSSYK